MIVNWNPTMNSNNVLTISGPFSGLNVVMYYGVMITFALCFNKMGGASKLNQRNI